ncbi:MAG: hypothetical protein H0V25_03235 [Solirubrobacterales bacterium]|nr:hypothetical protein [Solirubrobacterales bacterium]
MNRPDTRVFFHVGAPKTGTTYLQNVLFQNRELLAANAVLYPYDDPGQSFRSMQDFRGEGWAGGKAKEFAGEWEAVARRLRAWEGPTAIVSNELLGGSTSTRIERGLRTVEPLEVHVVFSARDFARQLVSDWQEHIKHKHTVPLEKFVDDLIELGLDAPQPFGQLFWGMHDASHVLERWAAFVPPERIHVVTVPQPGADADVLWRRFCAVTGLEPDIYNAETPRANPSMGVAETELVRRMNSDVQAMPAESYDPLVRKLLAEDILGGQSPRLRLPPGRIEWVTARSHRLIDEMLAAGYDVEGDLADLLPRPEDHAGYVSPTDLTDADLAPAALRAATGLLRHSGRQRRRIADLQAELGEVPPGVDRAFSSEPWVRRAWRRAGRVVRKVKAG